MKRINVAIGISAYNEEYNIRKLLLSILKQKCGGFNISQIVILSDGSDDKTVIECKLVKNKKIRIINGNQRKGKPARLNELFSIVKSDILVQLDADIVLHDEKTISNLIQPFIKNSSLDLVYGTHKALPPRTFSEKLAFFGFELWDEIRHKNKNLKDFSSGNIRAFSKNFVNSFRFPGKIGSGEDTYCYYYAQSRGFKLSHSPKAIIYIRLAATFKDYLKQMSRNMGHLKTMRNYFDYETINKYNSHTTVGMGRILFKRSFKQPLSVVVGFIILQTITRIHAVFFKSKTIWDIAKSSKQLT